MKLSRDCWVVVESTLVGINYYYLHITRDICTEVNFTTHRQNG